MNEELWLGVDLKIEYAAFHLGEMRRSISYQQPRAMEVAQMSAGAIVGKDWQRSFYPHFDAFLVNARSVPMIIEACFGYDKVRGEMTCWLESRDDDEKLWRRRFAKEFKSSPVYKEFRKHPLTKVRNRVVHRTGVASVEIRISNIFGVVYVGSPVSKIPMSASRPTDGDTSSDPAHHFIRGVHQMPIEPHNGAFTHAEKPLFALCEAYLEAAKVLVVEARNIAQRVHGDIRLSPPP
jgi:hypothetical protein